MTSRREISHGFRYPLAHSQAFPMGARVISWIHPAIGYGSSQGEQRIDGESGLPVWLVQVADLASVQLAETSVTVELLAEEKPTLSEGAREVEFTGLTVEPVRMGSATEPWTDFVYRALGVVAAPRSVDDTQPIPLTMLLELRSAHVDGRKVR